MATTCFTPMWPTVVRFTLLDNCGRPIYGPNSVFVTNAITDITISANVTEPEAWSMTRADGTICASATPDAALESIAWDIGLCRIDPELVAEGNDTYTAVYDYMANIVGFDRHYGSVGDSGRAVAVEMWTQIYSEGGTCDNPETGGEGQWGYVASFFVTNANLGGEEMTFGGEANPYRWTATGQSGARWGVGPYDVQMNPGEPPVPGPFITPVPVDSALRMMSIDVEPPDPYCGGMPLSNPLAPPLLLLPGDDDMTVCATLITDEGDWVIDWGDGSPTEEITGETEICHTYTEEDCYTIGVWADGNEQLYRAERMCVPQTMTLTVEPSSGEVPLEVVATVTGADETPTITWGD